MYCQLQVGFVENLEPIYQSESGGPEAKRARLDKRSSNEQETEGSSSVSSLTAPESPSNLSRSTASPPSGDPATHCDSCPFVADSPSGLVAHKTGHQPPKGLMNYKCAFCVWFSKKKPAVLEHMRLHTGMSTHSIVLIDEKYSSCTLANKNSNAYFRRA